jgi:hypothetical protein
MMRFSGHVTLIRAEYTFSEMETRAVNAWNVGRGQEDYYMQNVQRGWASGGSEQYA